jgi:hypothetical protein
VLELDDLQLFLEPEKAEQSKQAIVAASRVILGGILNIELNCLVHIFLQLANGGAATRQLSLQHQDARSSLLCLRQRDQMLALHFIQISPRRLQFLLKLSQLRSPLSMHPLMPDANEYHTHGALSENANTT